MVVPELVLHGHRRGVGRGGAYLRPSSVRTPWYVLLSAVIKWWQYASGAAMLLPGTAAPPQNSKTKSVRHPSPAWCDTARSKHVSQPASPHLLAHDCKDCRAKKARARAVIQTQMGGGGGGLPLSFPKVGTGREVPARPGGVFCAGRGRRDARGPLAKLAREEEGEEALAVGEGGGGGRGVEEAGDGGGDVDVEGDAVDSRRGPDPRA